MRIFCLIVCVCFRNIRCFPSTIPVCLGVSLGVIILAYVSYLMFLHIVIFNKFFQQVLMSLPGCVVTAVLVSGSVCGEHDEVLKATLLATTIFLSGITTFLQVTFGVRYCKINF